MALTDMIKRLVKLVHDPVDYPPVSQPSSSIRPQVARAESEAARQYNSIGPT